MKNKFADTAGDLKEKMMPKKAAIYRRTGNLREVRRRMEAAKLANSSSLLFQKLQHAM